MGFKFNPFSGNFDQTGSGGGSSYIDGEVATYSDLPLDGTAALNSAWLVREASGIWPVSRKQAGIYIRTATAGSSRDADYTYAGTMPDVFSDAVFTLYDDASTTRTGQFNLGSVTAGQNRVLTWPDGNGTIAITTTVVDNAAGLYDSANSVTGLTVSDYELSITNGTNVSNLTFPVGASRNYALPNASGTIARTEDFAAPPAIGSTTASSVAATTLSASSTVSGTGFSNYLASPPAIGGTSAAAGSFTTLSASTSLTLGTSGILSGGTNTIEQRNTTSAQTFRIYNTVSGAADANFERGFMRWSSNVLQIGTEKGGTGSARALEFHVDGVRRLDCDSNGNWSFRNQVAIQSSQILQINGGTINFGNTGAGDTFVINRDAIGTMALRSGTQAHALRIYTTASGTGPANFERLELLGQANDSFLISTQKGGTGSARGLILRTDDTARITISATGGIGFYGAAAAAQPAAVADATDAASTQARLNDLLARLRTIGLIAT